MADLKQVLGQSIGLLMALGSYAALRRRKSGFSRAKAEYPELAARLGLTHRAAPEENRIGSLRGTIEDHDVFVDPDERPRVVLYLRGEPQVVFRSFELEKRTPAGMSRFDSGNAAFDALFRERFAAERLAPKLRARATELGDAVARMERAHAGPYASVSVTPERIECVVEMGRPAHVPVETVTALLPALAAFARILEEIGAP